LRAELQIKEAKIQQQEIEFGVEVTIEKLFADLEKLHKV
jgi:hypothetical protein